MNNHSIRDVFPSKLGAIYSTEKSAESAMADLQKQTEISDKDLSLISPLDSDETISKKLEKEDWDATPVLFTTHAFGGFAGAVIGAFIAIVMIFFGPQLTQGNPLFTVIASTYVGAMLGIICAGAAIFRLDQDKLTFKSRDASNNGDWVVVFQGQDALAIEKARNILSKNSKELISTL